MKRPSSKLRSAPLGKPYVTRRALIRAFSSPVRTRAQVIKIVDQYIGDSEVPPLWNRHGIRGTFGRDIERLWSRNIKNLKPSSVRIDGRWIMPVVQSIHDFDLVNSISKHRTDALILPNAGKPKSGLVILDEYSHFASRMPV